MNHVEIIHATPCAVGESPIWDANSNSLWWVDIVAKTIHRTTLPALIHQSWLLPEMVGSIALADDGSVIAAMETRIERVRLHADGRVEPLSHTSVRHPMPSMRCNDGRCDPAGRFLVSTMFNDMSAALPVGSFLRLDERGVDVFFDKSVIVGNGLGFSNDGRTLYASDSHPNVQTVWKCEYDAATGTAHNPTPFIDFKPLAGRPDGAAVDADDCYWICANDGSAVYRFTPSGKLDQTVPLPVKKPAMCAFGGANFDVLFVTSIRPGGVDLLDQPLAGAVFAVRPGVQGREEPKYRVSSESARA